MTMIHAGTCSWTETTLLKSGEFYSADIRSAEDRLRYYATHFGTVEIDASYYAIPDRSNAYAWAERTPKDFIFHVKAYGALTGHGVEPRTLPGDILRSLPNTDKGKRYIYVKERVLLRSIAERFVDALSPLEAAGKLGAVLFQFPPWFHYRAGNLEHILSCQDLLGKLKMAVEFRHGSWLTEGRRESVFDFLRRHNIVYVTADEPQYGTLATIPFLPAVTSDIAYFRFHGRNRENWLRRGIETSLRYDYSYSDSELNSFVGPLLLAEKEVQAVYAMFNNCHGASAVHNAIRLKGLIDAARNSGRKIP